MITNSFATNTLIKQERSEGLLESVHSTKTVAGLTHTFYRYPARFSNEFVRQVISTFSRPGDSILDPFMGGGTTIVEALSMGRFAAGVDLNELAHFVATTKTTPLSQNDQDAIRKWLNLHLGCKVNAINEKQGKITNLPSHIYRLFASWMAHLSELPEPRQRSFMRCALLKTGQWAIDCRENIPSYREIRIALNVHVAKMLSGLNEFVASCKSEGIAKNKITNKRSLLCRSAVGIEEEAVFADRPDKFRLVVTSPPYYGVHVLYHRWQVKGRRETPAPYWIADVNDGQGPSYYTFGSRGTKLGQETYFETLLNAFRSIKRVTDEKTIVAQLVSFDDIGEHLPRYLETMQTAGYTELDILTGNREQRVWRKVPHRKWYSRNRKEEYDSMKEVLLLHRPQ